MKSDESEIHFSIHPSFQFLSIQKILSSETIKLDGESQTLEREYIQSLREFYKKTCIRARDWREELVMKKYVEGPLDHLYGEISVSLPKIKTKMRRSYYLQALLFVIALWLLVGTYEIMSISESLNTAAMPFILRILGGVVFLGSLFWFIHFIKNRSKLFEKKIIEEKTRITKQKEEDALDRQTHWNEFMQSEKERIEAITKMIAQDKQATLIFISQALKKLELPFALEGALAWKDNKILRLTLSLPQKNILPAYNRDKKKQKREKLIDENYGEVLAMLFLLLINVIYNTIPWLNEVEIEGHDSHKQQVSISLTRTHFSAMNFANENPFAELKKVEKISMELAIDKRININERFKKGA